jgi:hypothetical protein
MHVILDINDFEKRIKDNSSFPFEEGDTFVLTGMGKSRHDKEERDMPLFRYAFVDGNLVMEKDFIKSDEPATKKHFDKVAKMPKKDIVEWNVRHCTDYRFEDLASYADYEAYTSAFSSLYELIYSIDGYEDSNGALYAGFSLSCDQNQPLEDHVREVKDLIKCFPYHDMGDGKMGIYVNILEETLSSPTSYSAVIFESGECVFHRGSYGETEFDTVEELVKYIRKHHPYERKE